LSAGTPQDYAEVAAADDFRSNYLERTSTVSSDPLWDLVAVVGRPSVPSPAGSCQTRGVRLIVLGPGAAGKSTFARKLGAATGVRTTELDSVFWSADLQPLAPDEWQRVQLELTDAESWILDGDLGPHDVLETRLARADTVVLFDPSPIRCAWRALRRAREQREFWIWLVTWRRREKPRILAAIAQHAPLARLELVTTDAEAERLLGELSGVS